MGTKKLSQGVKSEGNGSNGNVFASCSFSSLGLDSNLCEQLHGISFFFFGFLILVGFIESATQFDF